MRKLSAPVLLSAAKAAERMSLVSRETVRADQLRADLQELALVAVVAGDRTEHLLTVIQADRQSRVIQTGRRDTRDGVVLSDAPRRSGRTCR